MLEAGREEKRLAKERGDCMRISRTDLVQLRREESKLLASLIIHIWSNMFRQVRYSLNWFVSEIRGMGNLWLACSTHFL